MTLKGTTGRYSKIAILSMISATTIGYATAAEDVCSEEGGSRYLEAIPLYSRYTSEFKPVKRWDVLAENLIVIPTNGYMLANDLVLDQDGVKGEIKAGRALELTGGGDLEACDVFGRKRGDLHLCIYDRDGDGRHEAGRVELTKFIGENALDLKMNEGDIVRNTTVAEQAATITDLANWTVVFGPGIVVRKIKKKKYIEVSYGVGMSSKTYMSDKARERCGEICMSYNGKFDKRKVRFDELAPVTFGELTVKFKLNDAGEIMAATEGKLEIPEFEVSCSGREISGGGMKLSRNF